MQNFLWQAGVQPPKIILYTYTFRLKSGLKLSILGRRKMQNPLRQAFLAHKMQILYYARWHANSKIHIIRCTYKLRLKKGLKGSFLAHQM